MKIIALQYIGRLATPGEVVDVEEGTALSLIERGAARAARAEIVVEATAAPKPEEPDIPAGAAEREAEQESPEEPVIDALAGIVTAPKRKRGGRT